MWWWLLSTATWIDLGIVILSELSQTEEDRCHMTSLVCVILNDTNTLISHGLETRSPRSRCQQVCCLLRPLSGDGHLPSPCPHLAFSLCESSPGVPCSSHKGANSIGLGPHP